MAGLLTGSSFPMPSRVLVMWSQAVAIGTYRKFYRSFTAAGLSGFLTRFPFNHYALILPEAAEGGSEPIAGAKVL